MLVFKNGEIEWNDTQPAPYDKQVHTLQPNERFEHKAECFIETLSENKQGVYEGGKFKLCSYTVSVNMNDVGDNFQAKAIRLIDNHKGNLGIFTCQRIEYYDLTKTIKIWV